MKRKTIGMIIGSSILATATIAVAPIVMTSCSFGEKASKPLDYPIQVIEQGYPASQTLLTKTAIEWTTIYSQNPDGQNDLLKEIKVSYSKQLKQQGFDVENALIQKVANVEGATPVLSNLQVNLVNNKQKKAIQMTITGLFAMTNTMFTPPSEESWTFNQIDLPSIAELDPKNISDAAWTNAINNKQSDPIAIPFNLYSVTQREYSGDDKYVLTYTINDQYKEQLGSNFSKYKPITVTINLSPYLNKELKEKFELTPEQVTKYLGTDLDTYQELNQKALTSGGQVEIYKKLADFVKAQTSIQPLRDCVNTTNNTIYNWNIMPQQLVNGCVIKFSTNPNSTTSQVYNYEFNITFPKQQSGSTN